MLQTGCCVWQSELPESNGHSPISVLPDPQTWPTPGSQSAERRDQHWQTGHSVENQPRGEGQASDQSATACGMQPHHMSQYTTIFIMPPDRMIEGILFLSFLSVCLFVCLSVCLSVVNFNLRYNFWTVRDTDFIFCMHNRLTTPFQMKPRSMTLWPWLRPWS